MTQHLQELKVLDAICVNIDTIADPIITIYTSDCNGIYKHSPEVISKLTKAARVANVTYRTVPFPFGGGGTDAFPFSKAGIKAASINAMRVPQQMVQFYHQEWDDVDKLDKTSLLNVLKITVEFLRNF